MALRTDNRLLDERGQPRNVQRTPVDVLALGDSELIPAQGAGISIRVVALHIRAGAAVSVRLKSGPSNLSAALSLGANDDFVLPYMLVGWYQTGANESLALNSSLAVAIGVQVIWVAVQP